MKSGARAVGLAESAGDSDTHSDLCGAVVRADRVVDGLAFGSCTVGGLDATDAVAEIVRSLDRPDATHLLLAGVAPAWYNLLDLSALHERLGRPTIAVAFEDSPGLESALRTAFSGDALAVRLRRYRSLPPRFPVETGSTTLFCRGVGVERRRAAEIVRAHTPAGQGRPEPLRVARLGARAVRE